MKTSGILFYYKSQLSSLVMLDFNPYKNCFVGTWWFILHWMFIASDFIFVVEFYSRKNIVLFRLQVCIQITIQSCPYHSLRIFPCFLGHSGLVNVFIF